jgi:hypothetical protein
MREFLNTMGSQKVPGMILLHCYGRAYVSSCLMTFEVRSLRARTHTNRSCHCWKQRRNIPEFGRRIRFDALHGCESCPLEAHFRSREQPRVTRSEIRRVQCLGDDTTNAVWLGALLLCRNLWLRLPLVEPLLL